MSMSGIDDDERLITETFWIAFEIKFLSTQMIYKGKTTLSLPKIKFPEGFSLSVNESYYSNGMCLTILTIFALNRLRYWMKLLYLISKERETVLVYQ